MPENTHGTIAIFKENAAKVSTTVIEVQNLQKAAEYALELCRAAAPKEGRKLLAVPGLPEEIASSLERQAEQNGVQVARAKLRNNLKSISVGLTTGDMAVADTASIIMSAPDEDPRLASMLSEIHVIAVPKSKVVSDSYEAEKYLEKAFSSVMYTTFISGCSRTSDIERVLTLGVHGPLELHVALLEEE